LQILRPQNCASHDKRWRRRHDVSDQTTLKPKSKNTIKNHAAAVNEYIQLIAYKPRKTQNESVIRTRDLIRMGAISDEKIILGPDNSAANACHKSSCEKRDRAAAFRNGK
jgi:hypothetical protein